MGGNSLLKNKEPYKCERCETDLFKIIEEDTLFDGNSTILYKIACASCGQEIENRINSNTLMIIDNTKEKIENLQLSMKTLVNQFNELLKSKVELKETRDILKSIDYITSIQQTIISLQKDKILSNVFNSAYIIMQNLPKNVEAKDYIMKPEGNTLVFNVPITEIKPFKEIGNIEIKGHDEKTILIKVCTNVDDIKLTRVFQISEPLGVYEVLTYLDMKINYPQKRV